MNNDNGKTDGAHDKTPSPEQQHDRDPNHKRLTLVREIVRVTTGIRAGQACVDGPTVCTH